MKERPIEREYQESELWGFVKESNRIEEIYRDPTDAELKAHEHLWHTSPLTVFDVCRFVEVVAGARIRQSPGQDVRVGKHVPPPGGVHIPQRLDALLAEINRGNVDPRDAHIQYETLHPFMDGNGRSGRALWAWQMLRAKEPMWGISLAFLRAWYYQDLQATRKEKTTTIRMRD